MANRIIILISICLLGNVVLATECVSADGVDVEKAARIKAAYLYHLARLAEWPSEKQIGNNDTLYICVVGDDRRNLSGFFSSQTPRLRAGERLIEVKHYKTSSDLIKCRKAKPHEQLACHLMFFTESESDNFRECLKLVHGQHILTTSEIGNFPQAGGMVGFVIDGDRVRIKVNQHAVASASLKISAEFLQHVDIIKVMGKSGGEG